MISTLALARLCGTSQGTVDRALHGRDGISPATRERILRAAAKHGHRPHPGMREMLSGRSDIVQAAFPSINNIFFMDLAAHLAAALRRRGLSLQLAVADDSKALLAVLEDAAARRHRLAIFIPPAEKIAIPLTLSRHLALFTLVSPCRGVNVRFLSPDERRTGRDGVDYLHGRGHRDILFVSSRRRAYAITARVAGYRERMQELGLRPHVVYAPEPSSWGTLKPTAIFCHNDWLAVQTILALQRRGLRVPQDVSVLGVDGRPDVGRSLSRLKHAGVPAERAYGSNREPLGK